MLKAIVVEDHPAIQEALSAALRDVAEVEVLEVARSEAEALDALDRRGDEADLVVLDVGLAAGSGLGVLKRRSSMASRCRFVVLTAGATTEVRKMCKELGADAVFEKAGEFAPFLTYCRESPSAR